MQSTRGRPSMPRNYAQQPTQSCRKGPANASVSRLPQQKGSPPWKEGSPRWKEGSPRREEGRPPCEERSPRWKERSPRREMGRPPCEERSPRREEGSPPCEERSPRREEGRPHGSRSSELAQPIAPRSSEAKRLGRQRTLFPRVGQILGRLEKGSAGAGPPTESGRPPAVQHNAVRRFEANDLGDLTKLGGRPPAVQPDRAEGT